MFQIPLADYIAIMRKASPVEHPYTDHPTHANELGDTFAALMHSLADFVEVGKEALGYDVVRSQLEDIVHTFPVQEDGGDDPFTALLKLMAEAVEELDDTK